MFLLGISWSDCWTNMLLHLILAVCVAGRRNISSEYSKMNIVVL